MSSPAQDRLASIMSTTRPRARSGQKLKGGVKKAITLNREEFQAGQQEFVTSELVKWVSRITGTQLDEKNFVEDLKSGEVLCDLLMKCGAEKIKGFKRLSKTEKKKKNTEWHARNNISLYSSAAMKYGVARLNILDPHDLEQSNIKAISNSMLAVARIAIHHGIDVPKSLEAEINKRGIGTQILAGKAVSIASVAGAYVGTRDPELVSMEENKTETEEFTVIAHSSDTVSFRTSAGGFLCIGKDGGVKLSPVLSEDCKFVLGNPPLEHANQHCGFMTLETSQMAFVETDGKDLVSTSEIGKNALFRLTIVGPGAKFEAPESESAPETEKSAPVNESVGDYAGLKSESDTKSESVITLQPGMGVASKQNGIGINEECKGESDSFLTKSGKNANAHDALLADKSSEYCCCWNTCYLCCPSCITCCCSCCIYTQKLEVEPYSPCA